MKLISWNVNGLRACMQKGFADFFNREEADIFCVQETKMHPEQADFAFDGYQSFWNSAEKKGYSGTAVFTRVPPLSVRYDMGEPEHTGEGRVITVESEAFFLVNVYTPNSQRDLVRLDYRMRWEDAFRAYLLTLNRDKPVVVCGDMNVAHREIDIKNPKSNIHNAGFTPEERQKMTDLLEAGFIDTFRALYPEQKDAYTWWSYMRKARERNAGWRIDYFLVSDRLRGQVEDSTIYADVPGSDHCPVGLLLHTGGSPA
ncbi:exodeoxyribonuclease III [Ethanoligenens harbinense]|uniref:Exodeoxyribonuclease III Xth n=1 Tax=Ethanoligenens harbinense (strain DSM 18485 / JCM 12961 / CGMCC 1.5033 / YUAN-3) TaxID=663278 RepID=E6U7V4_ETHHY|nr:exodeoxyribonuclease III [Ethanoligenens harbinense]ADU28227.1 exodeoxyribonuclease III Xth [Ethanoligenens harbinense YUAN-3]AVQ97223.1 exodeoxyribonuclease III [Ethanoligenens harbinense YUAN-3]AYF39888.1 exodeoxyribonuclease III [Ethanoligenens harbinense]AYF42719.1 exodeoxyribonuclease III [Ethanoligenens harbinense]QCN93469.1 exodeoxyribonuclease III [Ethanoligenens harbinense]